VAILRGGIELETRLLCELARREADVQGVQGQLSMVMAFARERVLALAGIGTDAAKAGAGAAASQAGMPVIGPALAAASGAVPALGGSIPSAARGWDIPAGVNPLAQLHEREMLLPAGSAEVIRDLSEQGGAGRATTLNVEIKAAPVPGGFFMVHKDELVRALKSEEREPRWVLPMRHKR